MATTRIEHLGQNIGQGIHHWFDRVQKDFQRRSGWRVDTTLSQFARLKGLDKVWFGGLLLGQAILGTEPKARPRTARRTSSRKKRTRH